MASNESKNEMLVMVLIDLSTICQKLTESSAVPKELQIQASELVAEFSELLPARGKGTAAQHFQGEKLLIKMARFLPKLLEVHAEPATAPRD
jgi:hypothetical protein